METVPAGPARRGEQRTQWKAPPLPARTALLVTPLQPPFRVAFVSKIVLLQGLQPLFLVAGAAMPLVLVGVDHQWLLLLFTLSMMQGKACIAGMPGILLTLMPPMPSLAEQ